jgi:hypothetical protein
LHKRFTAAIAINKRHEGWNQHRAGKTHDQNADNPNNG